MTGLSFGLRADNTASDLRLFIDKQDNGAITFCLVGEHETRDIQIDFEELHHQDALDLAELIRKRVYGNRTLE